VLLNGGYYDEPDTINEAAYRYLAARGVHVRYSPSFYALTHQKTLSVDGRVAAIMTLNFDGEYATTRDFAILDRQGPDVAAIDATFDADFADRPDRHPSVGTGDLVWSPGAQGTVLSLIEHAAHTVRLENEEMADTAATDALCADARRGVNVEVVMTDETEWQAAFAQLRGCGVHLHLYHGKRYYIHAKLLLVDGTVGLVGSENLSATSLQDNRELGIELRDRSLLYVLGDAFAQDYAGGGVS
jgi:cardiolipin synthase A/B